MDPVFWSGCQRVFVQVNSWDADAFGCWIKRLARMAAQKCQVDLEGHKRHAESVRSQIGATRLKVDKLSDSYPIVTERLLMCLPGISKSCQKWPDGDCLSNTLAEKYNLQRSKLMSEDVSASSKEFAGSLDGVCFCRCHGYKRPADHYWPGAFNFGLNRVGCLVCGKLAVAFGLCGGRMPKVCDGFRGLGLRLFPGFSTNTTQLWCMFPEIEVTQIVRRDKSWV